MKAVHPAATIFPMMSAADLSQLADDIRTNGQRELIVLWKGQVLDGRNRLSACEKAGVEPDFCEIEDESLDPYAYVLSANLHRRHLNESQRATVGAKMKKLLEPAAQNRKRSGKKVPANLREGVKGDSSEQAAMMLNVGARSVDHASTVLDKGSKELIAAVERGEIAVSRAAAVAKSTPKPKQMAEAEKPKEKSAEKTPLDHLKHWWTKANPTQRSLFRDFIDT